MGLLKELQKYIKDALPGGSLNPEVTNQGLLDAAAMSTMFAPGVGDVAGLVADANRLYNNPEERTPLNYGLAALGLIPFVPGITQASKAAKFADPSLMSQRGAIKPSAALKTEKAPRMSAAEAEAAGYWHPIGASKKLPIPISQMTAEREPVRGLIDRVVVDPQKMQGGAIFPFAGDRSIAGQNLLGIGGNRFENPVYLEGGYDFMRTHSPEGTVWASNQSAAQALQNRVDLAHKNFGGDVYGVYSAMGPLSMDYNVMMADALFEQMKNSGITKKAMNEFDKELKAIRPEWKGIANPESRMQLEANGALRTAFVDRMKLDKFQENGFPNIAYTRWALTDPKLLDEPMYSSGLAIGKMSPGSELVFNPKTPHKTYDSQLVGEYVGGFDQSVPREIMYPDWYKGRRASGSPESGDTYSFMRAKPIQPTNQEWLDGIMKYLESQAAP